MNEYDPLHGAATGPSDPLLRRPVDPHHTSILLDDCADDDRSDGESSDDASSSSSSGSGLFSEGFATLSRPIVVLDFVWNLAFILVSVAVLLSTLKERPATPLRLWLSGYALQCAFHVGFICVEYRRADYDWLSSYGTERRQSEGDLGYHQCDLATCTTGKSEPVGVLFGRLISPDEQYTRWIKRLESANTIISSMWWVFGFYWIVVGGQALLQDSPRLYWLTVVFLVFDVFFVIFCIGMAFLVFLALFCFIPVVAMLYAVVLRPEGASEDVIRNLPKHRYRQASSLDAFDNFSKKGSSGTFMGVSNSNSCSSELVLHPDDSNMLTYERAEEMETENGKQGILRRFSSERNMYVM
ncbi:hypothetical protein CDL15_Pgr001227 [Punica granatum]|uniref:RING-type E3 ubiquitin transferase n=2 Tax=Punica granatum TaxID=22663 RepID=A0A218WKK6_PUNGR|nr:hypothetical protein CDL15_Pgr001227 [Punica granatum]